MVVEEDGMRDDTDRKRWRWVDRWSSRCEERMSREDKWYRKRGIWSERQVTEVEQMRTKGKR